MDGKITIYGKRNTDSVSKRYETDSVIRFIKKLQFFLWNGLQNPFHNVLKRLLYSVLKKLQFFYEMEYRFRFKMLWNRFCIPFHKKNCNFFNETDYRIRFITFWNGICIPFLIHFDFYRETAFVFRLVKVWNALQNLFHKRFRYTVYQTEIPFHITSKQKELKVVWS